VETHTSIYFGQNVSTFLIIFRVAQGKGWSQDTVNTAMISTSGSNTHRTPLTGLHVSRTTFTDTQREGEEISLGKTNISSTRSVEKFRSGHLETV
jgi:hypothetical protein